MRPGPLARLSRAFAILLLAAGSLVTTSNAAAAPVVLLVGSYHGSAGQYTSIQSAVDAAHPGDWILVGPGDYHENGSLDPLHPAGVLITTPGIHLRGMDRNGVVVDGTLPGGAQPCSADPALQVTGRDGILVWKASGTYVGACPNCNAVLDHDRGTLSALGYSGTNSGGNLIIENTEFDHNLSGLVSNAQNNDDQPSPQIGLCPAGSKPAVAGAVGCTIFMRNSVHDNNNPNVPGAGASGLAGSAPVGSGIVLAGTEYVTLYQNRVFNNGAWGILVADLPDQVSAPPGFPECSGGVWAPPPAGVCYYFAFGNYTWANTLWNNGFFGNPTNGDLGLATQPHNPGNCFHANTDPGRPGGQPSMDQPNLQSGAPYYPCGQANGRDLNALAP